MKFTKEQMSAECNRRVQLLQNIIDENGLDALFFTSTAQQTCTLAVKYIANYAIPTRRAFIFMKSGETPKLLVATAGQQYHAKQLSWLPEECILSGDMMGNAESLIRGLGKDQPKIGTYETGEMPINVWQKLQKMNAELVDVTDAFIKARQNKSEYERICLKEASKVAVDSFKWVVRNLEPGKSEQEIVGGAEGYIRANGGTDSLVLIRAKKPHTFIARATDEPICAENVFVYSVEMAGLGGYWTQCIRPVFLSRGTQPEALRVLNVVKEAEAAGVAKFVPGNRLCDVAIAIEEVVAKHGCSMGVWSGHGMGVDLGDAVDLGRSNTMEIVPNMVLTIHPSVVGDGDGLLYGNTWISTEGTPECLTPGFEDCIYLDELKAAVD